MGDDSADDGTLGVQIIDTLVCAAGLVLPGWFRRSIDSRLSPSHRTSPKSLSRLLDIDAQVAAMAAETLDELRQFLAVDVDAQRSNPLAILRAATRHPTAVLAALDVEPFERSEFDVRVAPDDIYNLSPATWRDVDESLHEPGLMWGAWKAATVLSRRRGEGKL